MIKELVMKDQSPENEANWGPKLSQEGKAGSISPS